MPQLYQYQLKNNLIALNKGIDSKQIDNVIEIVVNCIKLNKKYFPNDYLKIFEEILSEEPSFENIFKIALNSEAVQNERDGDPLLIFLPAALYDICTDHQHDFMGQVNQKMISIIRNDDTGSTTNPEIDDLHSNIRDCDEDYINTEFNSKKSHSYHSLNSGKYLIEFLKTQTEIITKEEVATNEQGSWVDKLPSRSSKSVKLASSPMKINPGDGKGPI